MYDPRLGHFFDAKVKEFYNMEKISKHTVFGKNVLVYDFVNIYGRAFIGDDCIIGAFVEIQPDVVIGDRVKISSHTFICTGVTIESEVFIGHGVMFTNALHPTAVDNKGKVIRAENSYVTPTLVKKGAKIGSGCTILPGIIIGEGALIGVGSVVTKDVLAGATVYGNPAK